MEERVDDSGAHSALLLVRKLHGMLVKNLWFRLNHSLLFFAA